MSNVIKWTPREQDGRVGDFVNADNERSEKEASRIR